METPDSVDFSTVSFYNSARRLLVINHFGKQNQDDCLILKTHSQRISNGLRDSILFNFEQKIMHDFDILTPRIKQILPNGSSSTTSIDGLELKIVLCASTNTTMVPLGANFLLSKTEKALTPVQTTDVTVETEPAPTVYTGGEIIASF